MLRGGRAVDVHYICDDQCHLHTKKYHNYIAVWNVVYVVYIQLLCHITDGDDIG